MSLMFKPKIPREFSGCAKLRKREVIFYGTRWTVSGIKILVELRALNCSYKECGLLMGLSSYKVFSCVNSRSLWGPIAKRRKELIAEALK